MMACSTVQHSLAIHKDFAIRPSVGNLGMTNQAEIASRNEMSTQVEILNERLERLLELHGVLSKDEAQ